MSNYVKIIENCKRFRKTFVGVALQEDELGVLALAVNVKCPSDGVDIDCFSSHEYSVEPIDRDLVERVFAQTVDYQRARVSRKVEAVREAEAEQDETLRTLNRSVKYMLESGFNFVTGEDKNAKKKDTVQQRPKRQVSQKRKQMVQ